jgi:hypothetical protein
MGDKADKLFVSFMSLLQPLGRADFARAHNWPFRITSAAAAAVTARLLQLVYSFI